MKKLFTNLTFWVLMAIAAGALLGHFAPETAVGMEPLGKQFINVVKLFINPLIFLTITLGISSMGNLKKVGKVGGKALIYFEVVTTFALLIGIGVSQLLQPGRGVVPQTSGVDTGKFAQRAAEFSWAKFLLDNTTLQVLLISIVLGSLLNLYGSTVGERSRTKEKIIAGLSKISKVVFKALHFVMLFAPIGAFGGMAFTIGKYGLKTLIPLGKLMLTVYCTMGVFIFVVLWLILRYYRVSLLRFLNYIKEELLIVLGTSSSEAALPRMLEKMERYGCSRSVVGLVIPAGYSFNLDGTSIYLSMAAIFIAQAFKVDLTLTQQLSVLGVLMLTSKGAAGVTGSGFIVLASTLGAMRVVPVEGVAILLGVDRFMSEARAITNLIGNGAATLVVARSENAFDEAQRVRGVEELHAERVAGETA